MRLVTVSTDDGDVAGVMHADGGVSSLEPHGFPTVLSLIEAGPDSWSQLEERATSLPVSWPAGSVSLAPPIPRPPRNVVCVGVNYQAHFDEGKRPEGSQVPDAPVLFTKPWTSLVGHDGVVVIDRAATQRVDWEAELAVVVGVGGKNIPVEDALDHVFGWTLANDVSARDLQLEHGMFGQWYKGKSLDGFCPMGPAIVTRAEQPDYRDVHIQLRVNGELKQDFCAGHMVNSVERILARLSLGQQLLPGDVILTGTASGVGHWREPPEFLGEGSVVEINSPALGVLRTSFLETRSGA
jgi:2,4-didehydro-3-deoxy-L-rhamnonate hydrolase